MLLGGKPHGTQTEDGKRGQWKDFGTERQNGQKDRQKHSKGSLTVF